jgi:hypothetical protein
MWRINLAGDVPEVAFQTLRYKYVVFRRTPTPGTYDFEVIGLEELAELRAASQELDQWGETPTRDYGWL